MTSNYDDNRTVIGEHSGAALGKAAPPSPDLQKVIPRETRLLGKRPEKESDFITPLHTPEEDRPFFVRIGRGGLITALEELDRQLNEVRAAHRSPFLIGFT